MCLEVGAGDDLITEVIYSSVGSPLHEFMLTLLLGDKPVWR